MADEPVVAATPAASPLSSSPPPSPSTPPTPAEPVAASPPTPASPDGTAPTPKVRPEGIPDGYWDAEKNEVKLGDLTKKFNELSTKDAADAIRKSTLPADPAGYKLELPKEFALPVGAQPFKFDEAAPEIAQARAMAHAKGWTQQDFSDALAVFASAKLSESSQITTAAAAEVSKLGPTGPARVDAVTRWMDAQGLASLKSTLVTAQQVQDFEKHITNLSSQGTMPFSQQHRVAPDTKAIPGYEKMSFEQRRLAQDQQAASRRTA